MGRFGITQTLGSATEPVGSVSNFCAYIYESSHLTERVIAHYVLAENSDVRLGYFAQKKVLWTQFLFSFFSALIYRICGSFVKAFGCVDLVIRCSDCL